MRRRLELLFLIVLLGGCGGLRPSALRYPPVRWLVDRDRTPIEKPASRREYKYWDIAKKHFFYPLERLVDIPEKGRILKKEEAYNVNSFDEVPDSSWFTNRLGRYDLSPREVAQGPGRGNGPDPKGPWTILAAKTVGLTPGFLVQDRRGNRYLLKFDPPRFPELASGAEAISTRFFHAFGYNVPENSVVSFDPKILRLSPEAIKKDKYGKRLPFTEEDLGKIFENVEKRPDGRTRALASRLLEGEPLGPFPFRGVRRRDPNDRIPHEHRRELRGYRIFSAFLNHQDSREANTLDMFVKTEQEKGYVKHHLIDFGGTLGSGGVRPKGKEHLYDYRLNYNRLLTSLVSVGLYAPYWEKAEDPALPSVGMFESEVFRPEKWRPTYINPAFLQMTERDGFWAARIVMCLSNEAIEAVVDEARYSDRRVRDYLIRVLRERRDKIGRYWFSKVNPLDEFSLEEKGDAFRLAFADLAVREGLASPAETRYRYRVVEARNGREIAPWTAFQGTELILAPEALRRLEEGKAYLVRLQTRRGGASPWSKPVDVIIRSEGGRLALLGLRRH